LLYPPASRRYQMKDRTVFYVHLFILVALLLGAMAADEGEQGQKFDVVASPQDTVVQEYRPLQKATGSMKAHRVRRNRKDAEMWYQKH
ncbi:hypothetical protein V5799_021662, partial [Amblyomma americanum]